MRFVFPHSHAFRRGRVTVDDEGKAGPECLVEFGDGVTVIAEWLADGDAINLFVPGYRTAKGTLVTARGLATCSWQGRDVAVGTPANCRNERVRRTEPLRSAGRRRAPTPERCSRWYYGVDWVGFQG